MPTSFFELSRVYVPIFEYICPLASEIALHKCSLQSSSILHERILLNLFSDDVQSSRSVKIGNILNIPLKYKERLVFAILFSYCSIRHCSAVEPPFIEGIASVD